MDRIYRYLPWFLWRKYTWIEEDAFCLHVDYAPFWRLREKQRIEQFSEFTRWAR